MHPTVHGLDGKDAKMRLKIRYEQEFQTIELDAEATEELWVSLSLEGEGLTQEERRRLSRIPGKNVSTGQTTIAGTSSIAIVVAVKHSRGKMMPKMRSIPTNR